MEQNIEQPGSALLVVPHNRCEHYMTHG